MRAIDRLARKKVQSKGDTKTASGFKEANNYKLTSPFYEAVERAIQSNQKVTRPMEVAFEVAQRVGSMRNPRSQALVKESVDTQKGLLKQSKKHFKPSPRKSRG